MRSLTTAESHGDSSRARLALIFLFAWSRAAGSRVAWYRGRRRRRRGL